MPIVNRKSISTSGFDQDARGGSLDHLIGEREQSRRDRELERLGGPQIDDQLELGRRLHGKIGRFSPLRMRST